MPHAVGVSHVFQHNSRNQLNKKKKKIRLNLPPVDPSGPLKTLFSFINCVFNWHSCVESKIPN